jgi:hypothetical protein
MGWQPTPETGELPSWRRAGGAGANPARAGGEGGSGGVLEHEEEVGDWIEETEERGSHQKWRLHGDGTLSVGTRRRRLGTVVGVVDSASGEHRGAGGMLGEVKARPEQDQSGPPAVECPVAEEEEGRLSLRFEGGAPRLGSWRQMLGQLLRRLVARRGGSRRWRPAVGSRGMKSAAERGRARWRWCWRFEQTLLLTEDKVEDKDGRTGARGGAAWPAHGGREGRWHGAQLQLAWSEPTAARSERRPGARAGENGQWAGCPGGFRPVL